MKETTIKRESFFAYLYQFFYRTELPMGLCNFFWANLVALILIIPYTIWTLPMIITSLITNRKSNDSFLKNWVREYDDEITSLFGHSLLMWVLLLLVYFYGYGIYHMITMCQIFVKNTAVFWIVNIAASLVGIGYFIYNVFIPWNKERLTEKKLRLAREWYLKEYGVLPQYNDQHLIWDYNDREIPKSEKTTPWVVVIIRAIVSFYERNCPRINWE